MSESYQPEQTCSKCGAAMILDDLETAPVQRSWYLSEVVWAYWVCPQCDTRLKWTKLDGYEWKVTPSPTLQGSRLA